MHGCRVTTDLYLDSNASINGAHNSLERLQKHTANENKFAKKIITMIYGLSLSIIDVFSSAAAFLIFFFFPNTDLCVP